MTSEWPSLRRLQAISAFESWMNEMASGWSDQVIEPSHRALAKKIRAPMLDLVKRQDWKFDAEVGVSTTLALEGIPLGVAADPAFWDWVNVLVVPDFLCARWGIDAGNWRQKKAQSHLFASRRNWMGSLWWMVHLARDPGEVWLESTRRRLSVMNVDDVIAVVERPGQHGYPIDLYRSIVRNVVESRSRRQDPLLVRRVMLLCSLRTPTIVPELAEGGVEGFARTLVADAGGVLS